MREWRDARVLQSEDWVGIADSFAHATASGRVLYNHLAISVGFMSSSDKRIHFGLGDESRIATIEIRWPSGVKQILKDVAADQVLKVEEPK